MSYTSCSTDIDMNGPKKETIVTYAILDASKPTQYIKVNRAFLGEGNALEYAQIPDSTLFPYLLKMKVEIIDASNNVIKVYDNYTNFNIDTAMIYKDGTEFFSGLQQYYKFDLSPAETTPTDTLYLSSNYTYKLYIEDPVKNVSCESEISGLSIITLESPSTNTISGYPQIGLVSDNSSLIKLRSSKNAKIYEVKFIFYYSEENINDPSTNVKKTATWKIGSAVAEKTDITQNIELSYIPSSFYYILGQSIKKDDNLKRFADKLQIVITYADENLYIYTDLTSPSNSIIQERPLFTNISNGIGLFASKASYKRFFILNARSKDSLYNGRYTKELNFTNQFGK